jgi:hypothetical protein
MVDRDILIFQIHLQTNYSLEALAKMTDAELEQFYRERDISNGQLKK